MTRSQTAPVFAGVSALAFLVAAVLHLLDYRAVVLQAQQGLSGVTPLVATLWLTFAAAMLILAGMVGLVALGRVSGGRWVLALAACLPLITVVLQLRLLGFTRSTAVFAAVALVSLAAALAQPGGPESATARDA